MKFLLSIFFLLVIHTVFAQQGNNFIKQGNDAYAKGDFAVASDYYKKALDKGSQNDTAKYNLGNAFQKQKKADDAQKYYDEIIANTSDKSLGENSYYNKGVSLAKDKKFAEAADAFKQSLRMLPSDDSARENLQKVLNELKKQQQQQQKNKPQQQPQKQPKQKPQPQPKNQLTKQRAEQLLSNLREQEKELQKKLQQQKTSPNQPDKDW